MESICQSIDKAEIFHCFSMFIQLISQKSLKGQVRLATQHKRRDNYVLNFLNYRLKNLIFR